VIFYNFYIFITVITHRRRKINSNRARILLAPAMFCLYLSSDAVVRCFSDDKTAVWISTATGRTIRLDLEILRENSGSVSWIYH